MSRSLVCLSIAAAFSAMAAGQTTVTTIAPSSNTTPGVWYASTVTGAGQVGIVDLDGVGGDLESNLPLPRGAARLKTTGDNGDRANIGVADNYGRPDDIFATLSITYSWHKASNGTQNLAAAPSLKLAFLGQPGCAGDCFGQLIYEPNWNGVGATSPNGPSTNPALDTWTTVTVDENNGLFWWSGGFGIGSSAGGPPVRTLAEWRSLLSPDFGQADLLQVEIGVGSFNQNQLGYVDNVIIAHDFGAGYTAAYDFEPEFIGTDIAVGVAPCDVIAKDLTGDGAADIATADSGSNSVTVRVNDGLGGFGTSVTVPLAGGSSPAALACGDLFAGGGDDLAVAAKDGDAVILIDNSPAGTFAVFSSLSTLPATEPVAIDAGDLDGAGTDDIAVAMQGDLLIAGTGGVSISLNGGALTSLIAPVGGFLRPQGVTIVDLDGDGDNDVVVTMAGTAFSPTLLDNILLYENLGGGAFAAPIALGVSQNPRGLCTGDLDEDGDIDIAVTAESFPTILPGTVEVFENLGLVAGAWSPASFVSGGSFSGGTSPTDLACADLRDDSIAGFCALYDVIAVNFGSETVTHFDAYDAGTDSFAGQGDLTAGSVPVAVAVADFDGDKNPDIVVANKASDSVTVLNGYLNALAKPFGVGCTGTAGVPSISAVGSPTFLNPAFGVRVSNARSFAPTLFGVSLQSATIPLGGCTLYLVPPLVLIATATNGSGEATVSLQIPGALAGVAGCDVFFQYFIFDPNGAYNGQFAFSDALRIKIGN